MINFKSLTLKELQKLPVGTKVIHIIEKGGTIFQYTVQPNNKIREDNHGWSFALTTEILGEYEANNYGYWILYDSPEGILLRL